MESGAEIAIPASDTGGTNGGGTDVITCDGGKSGIGDDGAGAVAEDFGGVSVCKGGAVSDDSGERSDVPLTGMAILMMVAARWRTHTLLLIVMESIMY